MNRSINRVLIVGAGAVGSYVGAYLSAAGFDVILIDTWAEHIEQVRNNGLTINELGTGESRVFHPRVLGIGEVQTLAREEPVDVAIIALKSYDTEWATVLIRDYLAPTGFVVSMQNCMNEETIANIVGWGRTVGCIASRITVELTGPGEVKRSGKRLDPAYPVFRAGELHGRLTPRLHALADMLGYVDTTTTTSNLWGERWSKLCVNVMMNGLSAASGLSGKEVNLDPTLQWLSVRLGAEAVKVGRALGYALEPIRIYDPDMLVAAGDGDAAARAAIEKIAHDEIASGKRADGQRPSMGQDMHKRRTTEIDFINGFVARKAEEIGMDAKANATLTRIVKQVERGAVEADPKLLYGI